MNQARALKYLERVGIALSVLFNVLVGGPSNQTFSARNWEWKMQGYPNLVFIIDLMFIKLEEDHCKSSWEFWSKVIKNQGETRYEYFDNIRKR